MIGERLMKGGNEMLKREKKRSACSPSGSTRYRAIIRLSNCEARLHAGNIMSVDSGGKRQYRMQISGNSSVTDRWVKKKREKDQYKSGAIRSLDIGANLRITCRAPSTASY